MKLMVFIPARGDVISIDFDPQSGHEQAGWRPALVLSTSVYNDSTGLAVMCLITKRAEGYNFEVSMPPGYDVYGVMLADQVKCLDWTTRKTFYICSLPIFVLKDVVAKINAPIRV